MIEPEIVPANYSLRRGCFLIITQMYVICAVWPVCPNSYQFSVTMFHQCEPEMTCTPPAPPAKLQLTQHWSYMIMLLQTKTRDFWSHFSDTSCSCRTISARIQFLIRAILECVITVAFESTVVLRIGGNLGDAHHAFGKSRQAACAFAFSWRAAEAEPALCHALRKMKLPYS